MANDAALMFHGSTAAGTVMSFTAANTVGPIVDLGSNSVNRTLLLERRITTATGSFLDNVFSDSLDGVTFSAMPAATGALLGFRRATTTIFSSTDAIAPNAPDRITIRCDKRYVRMLSTIGTSNNSFTISVVGKVIDGGFAGAVGALDT